MFFIFLTYLSLFIYLTNTAVICDGATPKQTYGMGFSNEYLCTPNDFTITRYASSSNSLDRPRVMDHIIYTLNNIEYKIIYLGSVHPWIDPSQWDQRPGTYVKAIIDTNNDNTIDYTVNAYNNGQQEFNVVTIDPITKYVYMASQEHMYQCTNLHEYVLSVALNTGTVNSGCNEFISFPTGTSEATHARHYAEFSKPNFNDLCIAFGADCDNCIDNTHPRTKILCYNMTKIRNMSIPILWNDTNVVRTIAEGVRNSVGFDWHPETYDFWFTDNGANSIFDPNNNNVNPGQTWKSDSPDDELNVITKGNEGQHFGYPYQHTIGIGNTFQRDLNTVDVYNDYQWYSQRPSNINFTTPVQAMGPHTAVLGIKFYNRKKLIYDNCLLGKKPNLFPLKYNNIAFIAKHGSWGDGYLVVAGYKVVAVNISTINNTILNYDNFVIGFAEERVCSVGSSGCATGAWARPAFVEILDDGSLLISDDTGHFVFRVQYTGSDATDYDCPTLMPTEMPSEIPTMIPSKVPTNVPTILPTNIPTIFPTNYPSGIPTEIPSIMPSLMTNQPTINPTMNTNSMNPSIFPTNQPTMMDMNTTNENTKQQTTIVINSGKLKNVFDVKNYGVKEWSIFGASILLIIIAIILVAFLICIRLKKNKGNDLVKDNEDNNETEMQFVPTKGGPTTNETKEDFDYQAL